MTNPSDMTITLVSYLTLVLDLLNNLSFFLSFVIDS